MRTSALLAFLLVGGCVTTQVNRMPSDNFKSPTKSSDEEELERVIAAAFEAWRDSTVAGDLKTHYEGMTGGLISDWFWRRVEDHSDPLMVKWLPLLEAGARRELETWRDWHQRHKPDRAEPLPSSSLASSWLAKCYADYFEQGLPQVKHSLGQAQVKSVAVDGSGATVVTSLRGQLSERYVMVPGPDGKWRIDGYIAPSLGRSN